MQTERWCDINADAAGAIIAYAAGYLRHEYYDSHGRVHEGPSGNIGLMVEAMRPATRARWRADAEAKRMFTVALGMVEVQVDGRKFVSGPHTGFTIPPGMEAIIENNWALDAYLHITRIEVNVR